MATTSPTVGGRDRRRARLHRRRHSVVASFDGANKAQDRDPEDDAHAGSDSVLVAPIVVGCRRDWSSAGIPPVTGAVPPGKLTVKRARRQVRSSTAGRGQSKAPKAEAVEAGRKRRRPRHHAGSPLAAPTLTGTGPAAS